MNREQHGYFVRIAVQMPLRSYEPGTMASSLETLLTHRTATLTKSDFRREWSRQADVHPSSRIVEFFCCSMSHAARQVPILEAMNDCLFCAENWVVIGVIRLIAGMPDKTQCLSEVSISSRTTVLKHTLPVTPQAKYGQPATQNGNDAKENRVAERHPRRRNFTEGLRFEIHRHTLTPKHKPSVSKRIR